MAGSDAAAGSEGSGEEEDVWEEEEGDAYEELPPAWVPLSKRPEWADVVPIPQDDGPAAVVKIEYDEKFVEVYDYLRAVLAVNEVSQRALDLTTEAITGNQANYTAWRHRWRCVLALGCLENELAYTERLAEGNSKNYQLWAHRRLLAMHLGPSCASRELLFTEAVLGDDEKNIHAWTHRLAVVRMYSLWESEFEFTEHMIDKDVHNNSAWNQRFAAFTSLAAKGDLEAAREAETAFVSRHIMRDVVNEASWGYLSALYSPRASVPGGSAPPHAVSAAGTSGGKTPSDAIVVIANEALELDSECRFALAALAEEQEAVALSAGADAEAVAAAAGEATRLFSRLRVADAIRDAYWAFRAANAAGLVGSSASGSQ